MLVVVMALLSMVVVAAPSTSLTADPVFTAAFTTLPFSLSSTWEELSCYQPPRSEFFYMIPRYKHLSFFLGVKVMCVLKMLVWLDSEVI